MNLGSGAVRHPVAVLFFVLAVLLGGLFSYSSIEMESFPEFTMAEVKVVTRYPGAAPAELESLVTVPIETRLNSVKNVKKVISSSKEGQSVISITFDETINITEAIADVKRSIQEVANSLPDEATDPFVMAVAMSELPVITMSIIGNQSPNELKQIAEANVRTPLLKVSGVGNVDVIGGTKPCFEVIVDQQKLRRYNLALSHVSRAIQSSNLNMPGGKITYGDARFLVRTIGAFKNAADISAVPVDISRQPPVVVSDVAEVSETFYPFEGISRLNGKSNVAIHIKKAYGENILKVAKDCHIALRSIEKSLPQGVTVKVTADLSEFVEDQMSQVKMSAMLGGLLAVFILYIFLRRVTTTAIIALSIPMSILITLSVMHAYGYSLNYLSLAGMILALGMLVDDSIVVLENIVRHYEMGKSPVNAAIDGSIEIASPVLVSTITTVIVFAPVFLMSNWGPAIMLKHMAFSLVVAVSASYVVAMVVVPCATSVLFSLFHKVESDSNENSSPSRRTYSTKTWYVRLYLYSLGVLLRNPVLSLIAVGLVFLFSFFLVFQNGFKGNINISSKAVTMYFRFEEGIGKPYKEKVFDHFEQIVLRHSEITSVNTWTNEATGSGQIMANLGIRGKEASVTRIKDDVRSHFGDMAGVTVTFQNLTSMLGVFPVSVSIKGNDMALMTEATQIITKCLRGIKGLTTVENSLQSEKREVLVEIDRRRSAIRKVSEREIASTVRTALFGNVATRVVRNNRETDVVVKMDSRQAGTFRNLGDIFVCSTTGAYVPLREVANIRWAFAVPEIVKQDSQQIVKVNADVEDDSQLVQMSKVVRVAVNQLKLPKGVFIDFGGKAKEESKSQTKMLLAFFFSIFLVYGVMTIQFASFLHAFIIIAALPLALIGSNFSLYLTSVQFDVMAAVGIILLAGVVVNDSIVLVDYINQLREKGYTLVKAIVEAGLVRLRPILITSLTTIFGVLPMAFGVGHGAEVYVSLGITLVGGLTFSTILTLGIIPLVYMVTEKVAAKGYNILNKLLSYLPYG